MAFVLPGPGAITIFERQNVQIVQQWNQLIKFKVIAHGVAHKSSAICNRLKKLKKEINILWKTIKDANKLQGIKEMSLVLTKRNLNHPDILMRQIAERELPIQMENFKALCDETRLKVAGAKKEICLMEAEYESWTSEKTFIDWEEDHAYAVHLQMDLDHWDGGRCVAQRGDLLATPCVFDQNPEMRRILLSRLQETSILANRLNKANNYILGGQPVEFQY